jgi:hypothetical protein
MVLGADHYVAVSEEIATRSAMEFNPEVILNPIDLKRFKPLDRKRDDLPRVLIFTKNAQLQELCKRACGIARLPFDFANYQTNPVYHIDRLMPYFDIVISSGRGVYEALSCNCAAFVLARRPNGYRQWEVQGDGWVTEDNVSELVRRNCSGRTNRISYSAEDLAEELKKHAGPQTWGRQWVKGNHDVRVLIDRYLAHAEKPMVAA